MRRGSGSPPSEAVTANEPSVFGEWKSTAFACLFFWGAAVSVFLLCRIEIGKLPDVVPTLRLLLCAVLYLGTGSHSCFGRTGSAPPPPYAASWPW